jgi:hypothetical protein
MRGAEIDQRAFLASRHWMASLLSAVALSCGGGTLDGGYDVPHGALPIDERNPVLVMNDGGHDNWQGEVAIALSAARRMTLLGFVVNASRYWPDIDTNLGEWNGLVDAARASGLNVPTPIASPGPPLVVPASGIIEDTTPNGSAGAQFVVATAHRVGLPYRPMVVATGGQLTDVADAYLLDHSIVDLVVVVSSLGGPNGSGAIMGFPNGDADPWADAIVAARYRYVQVNAYYDQSQDVPDSRVAQLPNDAFGKWMAAKRTMLLPGSTPSDQISVMAAALPFFAQGVSRVSQSGTGSIMGPLTVPIFSDDASGKVWVVSSADSASATKAFWQALMGL